MVFEVGFELVLFIHYFWLSYYSSDACDNRIQVR